MQRLFAVVSVFVLFAILPASFAGPLAGTQGVAAAPETPPAATPVADPPPPVESNAAKVEKARQRLEAAQDISCTSSPFGQLLMIGGEQEAFVGYAGGWATPTYRWMQHARYDKTATNTLALQHTFAAGGIGEHLKNVSDLTGVTADLNGDGKTELIQIASDANQGYSLVASRNSGTSTVYDPWRHTGADYTGHSMFSAAAGNLLRVANSKAQQVAAVSRGPNDTIHVNVWQGASTGGIIHTDGTIKGWWREPFTNDTYDGLDITAADLDGDGYDDELIVAVVRLNGEIDLIVLQYMAGFRAGSNNYLAYDWQEVTRLTVNANGNLQNVNIDAGDIDGDFKDEVVLAWENEAVDNEGVSSNLRVRTFKFASNTLAQYSDYNNSEGGTLGLRLAVADSDRDGLAEPILAYVKEGYLNVQSFDAEQPMLFQHNMWVDTSTLRYGIREIAVAAGDMNRDGFADIVVALKDSTKLLQVLQYADRELPTGGIVLRSSNRNGTGGRSEFYNLSVQMGDWNDDSIKAKFSAATGTTLKCKRVTEPQIEAAIFTPPAWQNIQVFSGQYTYGTIGRSKSATTTTESAYTTEHTHSASVYIGGGVDVEVAEVAVKFTAGREWSNSLTRSNSNSETVTSSEGWLGSSGDYVVVDNTTYDCYSYQLQQGTTPIEGAMRFCAVRPEFFFQEAPALDTWDVQNSPLNQPDAHQWTPIVRDWSSLGLFRGANTVQSTTASGGVAARAVDGNTDGIFSKGSVTLTGAQTAPNTAWWQVDLGAVKDISKIRVWNRTGLDCGGPCSPKLTNFYVFVSDTNFRNISANPTVLKNDPRVKTYYNAGTGDQVTTFLTINNQLEAARGRFVRVQLAGSGSLALSEVQILGTNHVEPDRYPTAVSDPDGKVVNGKYVPGTDGWFLTSLYDPTTKTYKAIRTRGNLLWNGANYGVLATKVVGPGAGLPEWSLSSENVKGTTTATSIGSNFSVGAEFDISAGLVKKVHFGGSYQYTQGINEENSTTMEYGTGFEIGGGVTGFPVTVDGKVVLWPNECRYRFQPYYYEMTERTSLGFEQRFMVVDYIVPTFLNRAADLGPCQRGEYRVATGVEVKPNSVPFGNVRTGTTSAAKVVTLTNNTASALRIQSINLLGTYASSYIKSTNCPPQTTLLASGASCTITMSFKPTAVGSRPATLSISTDAANSPHTAALSGTGVAPAVTLSATTVAFGRQQVAANSAVRTVQLRNTGTAPLKIASVAISGDFVRTTTCPISPATLAVNATCTISLAFRPTVTGTRTGTVTITNDAAGSPHKINLNGIGINLSLTPTSLSFATQGLNTTSAPKAVVVKNVGTVGVPIVSVIIGGTRATSYARTHNCPATLAVGASCTVQVTFRPLVVGANPAALGVSYNAAASPRVLTLSGVGSQLALSTTTLAFGNQKVNTTSAARVVTLANRGSTTLTLSGITVIGTHATNFTRTTTCGASLAGGATCTVSVTFRPSATGARVAQLRIANNAVANPHLVNLSGSGTP